MKAYKKCESCKSDGLILCGEELQPCDDCNGVGYIEIEIPLEQCLEALKVASEYMCMDCNDRMRGRDCVNESCRVFKEAQEAIKAAEECMKWKYS